MGAERMRRDGAEPPRQVLQPNEARPRGSDGADDSMDALRQCGRARAAHGVIGRSVRRPTDVRRLLRLPASRRPVEREIDDEISFHFAATIAELRAQA